MLGEEEGDDDDDEEEEVERDRRASSYAPPGMPLRREGGGPPRAGSSPRRNGDIDLMYSADGSLRPGVDVAPLAVSKQTKLARISYVMRMLGASSAFVTDGGVLLGVLTRVTLFHIESQLFEEDAEERQRTRRSLVNGMASSPPLFKSAA